MNMANRVEVYSLWTDFDISLFRAGKHFRLYEKMGAHLIEHEGRAGVYFSVYAPAATDVRVIGDFNGWNGAEHRLHVRWDGSGIWEGFIAGIGEGDLYKYRIFSPYAPSGIEKADPFAYRAEHPPRTGSVVCRASYDWKDQYWMASRGDKNALSSPMSVYEVHLASWRRHPEDNTPLSYDELAEQLVDYVKSMGFTHVEFLPVMEYPYDPSWGYQLTGYFAPTSRFGEPEGLKRLIERLHQEEIGVILDWVPSHFPSDEHGLARFDGSYVYEHPDPRRGYHPDWKSLIFNYGRNEVRSFLISNALFWLDRYHADGLRVDAVASMLYLDYSRNAGEWEANVYGGNENLEAISFMKELNAAVYEFYPDAQTIAEESTSFPMVSRPTYLGGLGFGMKWMMGWMNDTLRYFQKDPVHRRYHHNDIHFSLSYAFTENFMLPLSHDEVVHGKGSLLGRMPGDQWQRFANLRLLFGYMFTHPGSKLLFMGGEYGQAGEWKFDRSLDWHLLEYPGHRGIQQFIRALNLLYRSHPAMYELQFEARGFEWVAYDDAENSVVAYLRKGTEPGDQLLIICHFTPIPREDYRLGVAFPGDWELILNSDQGVYGGSDYPVKSLLSAEQQPAHGRAWSVNASIPPLGVLIYTRG